MARRKQEAQLQQEIETQEEWEDMLSKEGLYVVDIYQQWCGPCKGMLSNLKKIRNDIGDELLKLAAAKADTIDALEKYRGHCEPCFLFYAGGVLVAVVRGANSPKILRTITEQLQHEHKVIDGGAERKEIKDPYIAQMESQEKLDEEEEEKEEEGQKMKFKGEIINYGDSDDLLPGSEGKKEITVCLIKPDAVAAGKVPEIVADIEAHGIEILKNEERHLTEDEVRQFYSHLQDESFFDDFVKFMTSGTSHVLVLTKGRTGENIISEFRDLIGPTDVEEAKEAQPESLRAKYGEKAFMNALHGSSSEETAMRELAFFFPDYVVPESEGKPKVQRTLALIRPDAFKNHKDEILANINEAGFKVAMQKEVQLTKEMAEDFYREHKDQDYFEELVLRMTSGPVLALGLAREDAISGWRHMLGPTEVEKAKAEAPDSLRAKFALDDTKINMLHGSDSEETAKKELEFFFPMQQTVAVIKPDAVGTKDEIIDRIHESGFKIAATKEQQLTRELAEEFYADHKGKDYYEDLVEHMTSGPTYVMVLSREDAVQGWREIIGPTDPEKAKEENPDSLRAAYGKNILMNAVHGSSTVEHAETSLKKIFGELKFGPDGSVLADEAMETEKREGEEGIEEGERETEQIPSEEPTEKSQEEPVTTSKPDVEQTAPEYREEEKKEEEPPKEDAVKPEEESKPTEEEKPAEESKPAEEEKPAEESKPAEEEKPAEESKPEEESKPAEESKPEESKPADEAPKEEQKSESPKPDEEQKGEEAKPEESEQKPEQTEKTEEQKPAEEGEKKEEEKTEEEKKEETPAEQG
ncbi:thioredoxin domain-containing protein 6-like isoform X2 [Saccostrea echinata]|uniref:thioredoxin domain-containing protein 6-like isoform X2 n=1 Tax=Saccostrea echinata TaxID=191078 RepID=UPI002A823470|nr:thioredoxin domain-containing protein 6-like isoform X2 [Saccostrea echinata]